MESIETISETGTGEPDIQTQQEYIDGQPDNLNDSEEPRFYSSLSDCLKWRPLYPLEEPLTEDEYSALGAAVCAYVSSHSSEESIDAEVTFLNRIARWRLLERLTPKEVRSSICTLTSLSNIIFLDW